MHAPSPHQNARARVATNLSFGLIPFALIAGLHPGLPAEAALPTWICLFAAFAVAGCLNLGFQQPAPYSLLRRPLSCLLLGSSLIAIPWKVQGLPFFPAALALGFASRWWLYALETRDLVVADRQRLALPCLATRYRRIITWITGALIPLLVISDLPAFPLLFLSFVLTVFSQWTVAGEACLARARRPADGRMNDR